MSDGPATRRPGGRQPIPRPAHWSDGGPARWAGVPAGARHLDLDTLVERIRRRGPGRVPQPEPLGARHSAVLIALFEEDAGPEVVLTRRSEALTNHRGEISFPGGRVDPGETAEQGALREAWEEVLLDPGSVEVVGELDHLYTVVSRSHIVPVVGRLPGRPELQAATLEVDRIFSVPLLELLGDDTYHGEVWGTPPFERPLYFFDLDDETVWGATARMLVQLLEVALGVDEAAGAV